MKDGFRPKLLVWSSSGQIGFQTNWAEIFSRVAARAAHSRVELARACGSALDRIEDGKSRPWATHRSASPLRRRAARQYQIEKAGTSPGPRDNDRKPVGDLLAWGISVGEHPPPPSSGPVDWPCPESSRYSDAGCQGSANVPGWAADGSETA